MTVMVNTGFDEPAARELREVSWGQGGSSAAGRERRVGWGGRDLTDPMPRAGTLPPEQDAQSPIQPGLGCCQGGGMHSFSGQPVPVPHHPHGEELLPNI